MNKISLTITLAMLALAVGGCASKPELLARSAGNPAGLDLSGRWALRIDPDAPSLNPGEQAETIRLPLPTSRRRQTSATRTPPGNSSKGPSVQMFIESGKALKISQTEHGLFVSFDRAIVEEFTFGENRTVSIGPIEAQRVSGWDGSVFVVETMDERGATLTETWALRADGSELVRDLRIVDKGKAQYFIREVFDRS